LEAHQFLGRLHEGPLTPARGQGRVVTGGNGVVDHNVDPTQFLDRLGHSAVDLGAVPHVTGDRAHRDAACSHLVGGVLRPVGLQLRDGDAGPLRCERERNAQPDALSSSGDDCHLAVESSHAIPLVVGR
jgi:hypothetical protein